MWKTCCSVLEDSSVCLHCNLERIALQHVVKTPSSLIENKSKQSEVTRCSIKQHVRKMRTWRGHDLQWNCHASPLLATGQPYMDLGKRCLKSISKVEWWLFSALTANMRRWSHKSRGIFGHGKKTASLHCDTPFNIFTMSRWMMIIADDWERKP